MTRWKAKQTMSQVPSMTTENVATNDVVTYVGNSVVQHGRYNNRIYLMKLSREDFPDIIDKLNIIALENGYSKIFAKIPLFAMDIFIANDYKLEASIPISINGEDRICFMGKYLDESRAFDKKFEEIEDILNLIKSKEIIRDSVKFELPKGFRCEKCNESHVAKMANVYGEVFHTYPFPINDKEYIRKTMNKNFVYFCILKNNEIVALSSSEMDEDLLHVEMTDFATLPEYQNKGFALYLLHKMEEEMRKRKMMVAYTISRAVSHGINMVFAKMGYRYGGTLRNNTNISVVEIPGNFESMNIWYKFI